jgi:hypothetical protein
MAPKDALNLLKQVTANIPLTRDQHVTVLKALEVLEEKIKEEQKQS